jgi:hypothetical protein
MRRDIVTQMGSRVHRLRGAFARRPGAGRLWKARTPTVDEFLDAIERHYGDALFRKPSRADSFTRWRV